jgi:hypothetical protein
VAGGPPDTVYTDTGLSNGTTYYYRITAVDSAGNASGFSSEVSETPFGIASVSPVQSALNVSRNSNVTVTFDTDMLSDSLNARTFIVRGNYEGDYAGTYSYDGPSRTATFDPDTAFTAGEVVTVTLTSDVTNSVGQAFNPPNTWSFTAVADEASGTFATEVTYGVSSSPYSMTSADMNGDNNQDLMTANLGTSTVTVLLGDGDGTFCFRDELVHRQRCISGGNGGSEW